MSISYATATKNARLVAALTAAVSGQSVDGNTSFGKLVIGTSALSGSTGVLVTITLQKPSFTITGGVATMAGLPLSANATATGTAAKAELRDSAGNTIASGLTVGTSGTDIIIFSTSITSGETVRVSSAAITAT